MRVGLDIQHRNKPINPGDRGSHADLNADGVIERAEFEDQVVADYMAITRSLLEARGIGVLDGFSGTYAQRNAAAGAMGCSLYLAGHVNAGGGDYGMVAHDYRAPRGGAARTLASLLSREWRRRLGLGRVRVEEATPYGAPHQQRLFACIGRAAPPALVLEPLFIDGHAAMLTPARRVGTLTAIADGIVAAIVEAQAQGLLPK